MADLEALHAKVAELRENQIGKKSRQLYQASNCKFILWCLQNNVDRITPQFIEGLEEAVTVLGMSVEEYIKSVIGPPANLDRPPFHFRDFAAEDFLAWIVDLKKEGGEAPGISSLCTHRSGFFNLYRDFHEIMPPKLEDELQNHF